MDKIKKFALISVLIITMSCSNQRNFTTQQYGSSKSDMPSIDDIFKMDLNGDGKLTKLEAKDPLLNDFDKLDLDKNGFLASQEIGNASKPNGPPPGRHGQTLPPRR